MDRVDAALLIRTARTQSNLSLRALAARAGTSHATLSAYENGRIDPGTAVFLRILSAAGRTLEASLLAVPDDIDGLDRGEELAAVLELAEQFPARHSPRLECPVFGST
jgi:transcriptional regulator with XRE-family HTH domain